MKKLQVDKAYPNIKYNSMKQSLKEIFKKIKAKTKHSEHQKTKDIIIQEYPKPKIFYKKIKAKEGRNNTMNMGNGIIAVIIIIMALLIIAAIKVFAYLKKNNKTTEKFSTNSFKPKSDNHYTIQDREKDKDMLELIHELSSIYQNIDEEIKN